MAALLKLTLEFQLPAYQPFCDQSKPPCRAGDDQLVLPWSWPRNLYFVVRLMLAVNGEAAGSGADAAAAGAAGDEVCACAERLITSNIGDMTRDERSIVDSFGWVGGRLAPEWDPGPSMNLANAVSKRHQIPPASTLTRRPRLLTPF